MRVHRLIAGHTPAMLLLLALGTFLAIHISSFEMLVWDEAEYAAIGRSAARGEGFRIGNEINLVRPPVLPLSVAASLLLFGEGGDAVAKIPSIVYTLLLTALTYWAVSREYGRDPGLAAAVAVSVSPEIVPRGVMLLSETPFAAAYLAAVVFFARGFGRDPRWFYAAWAAWALSLSTRYTALLFGPTILLFLGYEAVRDRAGSIRTMRRRAFWAAPAAAVPILAPWYVRQWITAGDPLHGVRYAAQQIPSYSTAVMPWSFYLEALPAALTWPVLAAGLGGFFFAVARGRRLGAYAAAAALVLIAWHSRYDYKEVRLIVPALPFFALGVGEAAERWVSWSARRSRLWRRAVPAAVFGAAAVLGYAAILRTLDRRIAVGEPSLVNAMDHVRAALPKDVLLGGAAFPQIVWYADRPTLRRPEQEESMRDFVAAVDWVVITNFEQSEPAALLGAAEASGWSDQLAGDIQTFRSGRYQTLVARSDWVLRNWPDGR